MDESESSLKMMIMAKRRLTQIEGIGELKKKQFEFKNQRECNGVWSYFVDSVLHGS